MLTVTLPQVIGLRMNGNEVMISFHMLRNLNLLQFPLVGHVIISDDRPSCNGVAGPCQAAVPFSLDLVQYAVPCPGDLLRFTPSEDAVVEWTAPVVRKLSGPSVALRGPYSPGDNMTLGTTLVEYELQRHSSQDPATRVTCSFTV